MKVFFRVGRSVTNSLNVIQDWLGSLGTAFLHLLIQPYYYIAIIFIALYYRRQVALERKLIHVKLHSWGQETWRTVWSGLVMGLVVSIAAILLGVSLSGTAVACIWVVSIVLSLLRVRYLCFAYSIGLLGVIQFVLNFFPNALHSGAVGNITTAIREMDIPALLVLAALLHMAEALLARWQGAKLATPLFLKGKRGMVVGGYQLQAFWPLPLFLLIPSGAGTDLPWQPLLGGGLGVVSLPVIIGFSEMTQGMLPGRKAARTSRTAADVQHRPARLKPACRLVEPADPARGARSDGAARRVKLVQRSGRAQHQPHLRASTARPQGAGRAAGQSRTGAGHTARRDFTEGQRGPVDRCRAAT